MAVSYSKYKDEYNCCFKTNDIYVYVYLDFFGESFHVGKGLVNYYSSGLVFESNLGEFAYYISPSNKDFNSVINLVQFNVDTKDFKNIGIVEVSEKNMRLNSLDVLGLGSLSWVEYDFYNSYNDFETNISIGGI